MLHIQNEKRKKIKDEENVTLWMVNRGNSVWHSFLKVECTRLESFERLLQLMWATEYTNYTTQAYKLFTVNLNSSRTTLTLCWNSIQSPKTVDKNCCIFSIFSTFSMLLRIQYSFSVEFLFDLLCIIVIVRHLLSKDFQIGYAFWILKRNNATGKK